MVDKRTQKLVKEARKNGTVAQFREANARQQINVDMTTGGEMVRVEPAPIEASYSEVELEPIKDRDYLAQANEQLEASQTNAVTGLINVKAEFDKLLDPKTGLEDLVKLCGTMTHEKLEESKKTIELIRNSQEYRKLELEVRSTEIDLQKNNALLILKQFEAQIEIARKANKVARDHDNLDHEVELRSLNQQRNQSDQAHVAGVNQLTKDDQENYRESFRKRNEQQAIIRGAMVQGWVSNAAVAVHRSNIKTAWADRLTKGGQAQNE